MSTSIFDDAKSMIEVWKQLRHEYYTAYELASNAVARFYNLIAAIIPVYFVGLGLVFSEFRLSESIQIALLFSLGIFPMIIVGLAVYGKRSLDDRSKTMLAIHSSIMNIQTILKLDDGAHEHLKGKPLLGDVLPSIS